LRSYGWSRKQVGSMVTLPNGTTTRLTMALVDEGIERVTALLDDASRGHHYAIKGLSKFRLPPGSLGAWSPHKPEMVYKVIEAAKTCGLAVAHFDLRQKAL
jgi:hypothetical protein